MSIVRVIYTIGLLKCIAGETVASAPYDVVSSTETPLAIVSSSDLYRANTFIRPTTTRRPFKKRPTTQPPAFLPAPAFPSQIDSSTFQTHPELGEMSQPPFDSGPYKPPSPPPVPVHSSTHLEILPAPPGKPQRPLPPSRPFQYKPWPNRPLKPPPQPPLIDLPTYEEKRRKPELVFSVDSRKEDGSYSFEFLVDNSVYRKEQGFFKKSSTYPEVRVFVKTGTYSFVSPQGTYHRVDFIADEFGYRVFTN